ncbi:hypothetical protein VPH35_079600 [Triticum aestivum]
MVESVCHESQACPRHQGPELRERRRGRPQQERPPPRLQPRAQEDPRAHPQRRPRLRVHDHRAVHRRGVRGHRAADPPRRPPRARRRPFLGGLRRRQAGVPVDELVQEQEQGGGRGDDGDAGCRGGPGGSPEGVLQGEGLLRRRRRRAGGHRAGEHALVADGDRGHVRRQGVRPRQDPAAGGVDGAFRLA